MNVDAFQLSIFNWLTLALTPPPTGLVIYWDHPNAPRPKAPAVKMRLINGPTMIGIDELVDAAGYDDAGDGHLVLGLRSFILSLTAYGDTAQSLISKIQTSISHPAKIAQLSAEGISVLSFGPTRDVSAFLETKTETRHQVDVNLLAREFEASDAGVIEVVAIEGEVIAEDGDEIPIEIEAEQP